MSESNRRFWAKVNRTDGCWLWTAGTTTRVPGHGYGRYLNEGKEVLAHRFAYEVAHGPIPDGLVLDHLCRVGLCVRPDHLEPVTIAENTRRGDVGRLNKLRNAAITHCPQGHPYDEQNTYSGRNRLSRQCRACSRQRHNGATADHLCRACAKRHHGNRYPSGELMPAEDGVAHREYGGLRLCDMPISRVVWA
jgi:hypothetical protein